MKYYDVYYNAVMMCDHEDESRCGRWCRREEVDAEIATLRAELEAAKARISELEKENRHLECWRRGEIG